MVRFQKKRSVSVVIVLLLALGSCFRSKETSETGERIYASVNGANLTESEFRALVPPEFFDRITPVHKKEIVREWVNNEMLYQEALRLNIDKEPEIARILKKSRRDLLSAEILERKMADVQVPGDDELKRYYDEHSDYFILPSDEYKVRFALFDNMKDAKDFYDQVKRGASFSDLAIKESKDPTAQTGGILGTVNEELVEPAIWEAVVSTFERLGLTKISSPFSVIDGFGIVIVDEVYERGTLKPFESVRDHVLDYYMIEKREEAKQSLLLQLMKQAKIEYHF